MYLRPLARISHLSDLPKICKTDIQKCNKMPLIFTSCVIYLSCTALRYNKMYGGEIMEQVYEFLKKCGVFYLATTEGDQPRVRPFGVVF